MADAGPVPASLAGLDFFAFSTPRYGANLAGGDVDADGPGPAIRPKVLGFAFNGTLVRPQPGFYASTFTTRHGAGLADLDRDVRAELLAGPGPDPAALATVAPFTYDGSALQPLPSFEAFTSSYGVNVAGGFMGR